MPEPGTAIAIREVGPRDGLQPEAPLDVATRLALIAELAGCGFSAMEVAAFVSERAVPAMAGAADTGGRTPGGRRLHLVGARPQRDRCASERSPRASTT